MQKKSAMEELQEEAEEAQDGDEESPEEKIDDALDKLGTDPTVQEFQNLRRQQTETLHRTREAITVVAEVAGAIAPTPVIKLSALGKLGKLLKRGGKKGDEAVAVGDSAGVASSYADITDAGSRRLNKRTDVTKSEFERNLIDSGYTTSTSKDGKATILEKSGSRYVLRDNARSAGGPTADYYKPGSTSVDLKIRLEQGSPR